MKESSIIFRPAIVRYIGSACEKFTKGLEYEAYFVEYWEGKRHSLHVKGNNAEITDFNPLEDFEIVSDVDDVLNDNEATVRCITDDYDEVGGLTCGKDYVAIGRDKNGMYLVKDNSEDCYFYPANAFEIIADIHGILEKQSIYYSFEP